MDLQSLCVALPRAVWATFIGSKVQEVVMIALLDTLSKDELTSQYQHRSLATRHTFGLETSSVSSLDVRHAAPEVLLHDLAWEQLPLIPIGYNHHTVKVLTVFSENASKSELHLLGHPCSKNWNIRDKIGSFSVQARISFAVTGESWRCSASNTSSGGVSTVVVSTRNCNLLRASAFA